MQIANFKLQIAKCSHKGISKMHSKIFNLQFIINESTYHTESSILPRIHTCLTEQGKYNQLSCVTPFLSAYAVWVDYPE